MAVEGEPSPEAVAKVLAEATDLCVLRRELKRIPLGDVQPMAFEIADPRVVELVRGDPNAVLPLLVAPAEDGYVILRGNPEYAVLREAGYSHAWAVVAHECWGVRMEPKLPGDPGYADLEDVEEEPEEWGY